MTTSPSDAAYEMEVTVNDQWQVVVVSPETWKNQVLKCPGRISNGLSQGRTSTVLVDTTTSTVISLVQNRAEEERQQAREDAEFRKRTAGQTVHNLGQYAEFVDTAYRHFDGSRDDARTAVRALLESWDFTVASAHEDYEFSLDIKPPSAANRFEGDNDDNWTIGGKIEWTGQDATGLRIWHFGPSTAHY